MPGRIAPWGIWVIALALLASGGVLLSGVYLLARDRASAALERDARVTAQLQVAALESELEKERTVPRLLADDSDVRRALEAPSPMRNLAISRKLARLLPDAEESVGYVVAQSGLSPSASNYEHPDSFADKPFGFRRYVIDGLAKGSAEEFALGSVSMRPGFYIAHRVTGAGAPLGVVVVKVQFDAIEASWRRTNMRTMVTDSTGHIILTNNPALRFHKLSDPGPDLLATTVPVDLNGWNLTLFSPRQGVRQAARSATLIAFLALALLASVWTWMLRRRSLIAERAAAEARYRDRLEGDVAARTLELSETNGRLSGEIQERLQAERRLNDLQADLVQANKLAQLGQITAGVAHEMNQPLATIRVLAENALTVCAKPGPASLPLVTDNLGVIVRMCERITHITGELRTFSRKATGESGPVSLRQTLDSSILLNKSRLRENRVRLVRDPIDGALDVLGGRIRLEQILVNLLQNAFEALEGVPNPVVRILIVVEPEWVWLRVRDNGPGLEPRIKAQLFTPFVTSKEAGLGLGLVIARDIVREFGGDLTAEDDGPGTTFTLKLKRVIP